MVSSVDARASTNVITKLAALNRGKFGGLRKSEVGLNRVHVWGTKKCRFVLRLSPDSHKLPIPTIYGRYRTDTFVISAPWYLPNIDEPTGGVISIYGWYGRFVGIRT